MKLEHIIASSFSRRLCILCLALLVTATGCKKYVSIPLPVNTIAGSAAFTSDNSAAAVLNGIYASLSGSTYFDGTNDIGFNSGLYTDELVNIYTTVSGFSTAVYYGDAVQSSNTGIYWTNFYSRIYAANLTIEGVTASTLVNKNQWLGEALFLRAFLHFYLTNLYGDVPIVTTSSYPTNRTLLRSPQADVYKQIVADLLQAQGLLTTDYRNTDAASTTDRGRPNLYAVNALLARVYLYMGSWQDAEAQASTLIGNTSFLLPPPAQAFLAGSKEPIWWLTPNKTYVGNYYLYNGGMPAVIPAGKTPASYVNVTLSTSVTNAFDSGDARFSSWVRSSVTSTTPAVTYYFPNKYKSNAVGAENIVLFRLAEQYLIRAEARAKQNNLTGAKTDLDAVRARAGLAGTTAATQANMLAAIAHERQVELFTEEGHRFFDLRRTGTLDPVMTAVAPSKNATWSGFMKWWPIPSADVLANPGLTQTPGYQ